MSFDRFSNSLPPIGGMTGALLKIFPDFTSITQTAILAIIGAVVGYVVKVVMDKLFKKAR